MRTPKRINKALDFFEKLVWRHGKCGYKPLLNTTCPSKVSLSIPYNGPEFIYPDSGQRQRAESRYPRKFQHGHAVCVLTEGKRSTCRRDPRSCLHSPSSLLTPPPTPTSTLLSVADSHRRRRMPSINRDLLISLAAIQRLGLHGSRFQDSYLP